MERKSVTSARRRPGAEAREHGDDPLDLRIDRVGEDLQRAADQLLLRQHHGRGGRGITQRVEVFRHQRRHGPPAQARQPGREPPGEERLGQAALAHDVVGDEVDAAPTSCGRISARISCTCVVAVLCAPIWIRQVVMGASRVAGGVAEWLGACGSFRRRATGRRPSPSLTLAAAAVARAAGVNPDPSFRSSARQKPLCSGPDPGRVSGPAVFVGHRGRPRRSCAI